MSELDSRFSRCIVPIYRRQMNLLDKLANREWSFELNSSTLRVGGSEKWTAQVLSIETAQGDWMWAWADDGHLTANAKTAAEQLKKLGREKKITEFVTPRLSTEPFCCGGHTLAVVAAAQFRSVPYFVATHGPNRLYLLITDLVFRKELPPLGVQEFFLMLPQLISDYSIPDHSRMIVSFLRKHAIDFRATKKSITFSEGGRSFRIGFDKQGRADSFEA